MSNHGAGMAFSGAAGGDSGGSGNNNTAMSMAAAGGAACGDGNDSGSGSGGHTVAFTARVMLKALQVTAACLAPHFNHPRCPHLSCSRHRW